jgi:probable phosphoglycerate mutase
MQADLSGATELVLVRPGAVSTTAGFAAGESNPALSTAGVDEARRTAARLAREPIAALFVTPLRRTAQTAQPLAAVTEMEPNVIADLREILLGHLESSFATPVGRT